LLYVLVQSAEAASKRRRLHFALQKDSDFYRERYKDEQLIAMALRKVKDYKIEHKGKAKAARWPTRSGRKLAAAGESGGLRELIEKEERERWKARLFALVVESGLPAADTAADEMSKASLMNCIGKGQRAGTLRQHVRAWEKASCWIMQAFGHASPMQAREVLLYVEARLAEPCGRHVLAVVIRPARSRPAWPCLETEASRTSWRRFVFGKVVPCQAGSFSSTCSGGGHGGAHLQLRSRAPQVRQGVRLAEVGQGLDRHEVVRHAGHAAQCHAVGCSGLGLAPPPHQDKRPWQV
jgi:hypothetical protein